MIYALVDDKLFIKKLYTEEEFFKIIQVRTIQVRPIEDLKYNGFNLNNKAFKFYDNLEAKVYIAQKRIEGIQKEKIYDEENGYKIESYIQTVKKSKEFLKRTSKKHPEYFI